MKNFCNRELRKIEWEKIEDWALQGSEEPDYEFFEDTFTGISADVPIVINMMLSNPGRYNGVGITNKQGIGNVRRDLRSRKKWTFPRINQVMRNLRIELLK